MRGLGRTGLFLLLLAAAVGCALGPAGPAAPPAPQAGALPARDDGYARLSVPFFPDDTDQCGATALASLLHFWGASTDPQALKRELRLPYFKGTLPIDLVLAAQRHGFRATIVDGSIELVRAELRAGRPLVAFLNLGSAIFPQGHYVVVTGFDDRRQGLYVHSGLVRDLFVPYERFLRSWEKMDRWTLLVLPVADHREG